MEQVTHRFSISAVRVNGDNKRVLRNKIVRDVEEVTSLVHDWLEENKAQNDVLFKIRTVQSSDIKPRRETKSLHILPETIESPDDKVKNLIRNEWKRLPEKHRHYAYIVKRLSNQWPELVTWERFLELYKEVIEELGGVEE